MLKVVVISPVYKQSPRTNKQVTWSREKAMKTLRNDLVSSSIHSASK